MKFEGIKFLLMEQTKSAYAIISVFLDEATDEEYNNIPIVKLTDEQEYLVKKYAVIDIPLRETNNFLSGKPYYDLYYVAPTLFRVYNENKKELL